MWLLHGALLSLAPELETPPESSRTKGGQKIIRTFKNRFSKLESFKCTNHYRHSGMTPELFFKTVHVLKIPSPPADSGECQKKKKSSYLLMIEE